MDPLSFSHLQRWLISTGTKPIDVRLNIHVKKKQILAYSHILAKPTVHDVYMLKNKTYHFTRVSSEVWRSRIPLLAQTLMNLPWKFEDHIYHRSREN